ncbi:MAG TPA: hypothetical protein VGO18_10455 [Steroidobacteraceae bacterium]|nr:hypothetical protein [Steroidobacteraceae bacterium]
MSDRIAPPRLLLRLEAEIASARSQLDADCKRAERAAYLARLGRFEEARNELDKLQGRYAKNPNIELSIWTNFAEGVMTYFDNVGAATTDRVQRAYALSVAAGRNQLRATCAAWLAQWDYSRLDMDALARHVREALAIADPDHHVARSRACLVVAQALHLAGRADLAKSWYSRTRFHASVDGDDVTISALMHNMAWLRMLTMRQTVLLDGQEDVKSALHALTYAQSTEDFDEMKGDSSWMELKPILRAQIVSLQGNPNHAVALYEEHLATSGAPSRLQANLFADKAWCHIELGNKSEAIACAELARGSLIEETQIDDRAAAHSRLAQVFAALGDSAKQSYHFNMARDAWRAHIQMQLRVVELLAGMDDRGNDSQSDSPSPKTPPY